VQIYEISGLKQIHGTFLIYSFEMTKTGVMAGISRPPMAIKTDKGCWDINGMRPLDLEMLYGYC